MKTFVLGDIHGAYKALLQVIERSGIDKENDRLIFLGDVTDGWSETPEAIEELLSFKNLIPMLGNHDHWTREFLPLEESKAKTTGSMWWYQGGGSTYKAYQRRPELKEKHIEFLNNMKSYYFEDDKCFVHGGLDMSKDINEQDEFYVIWDRRMWETVYRGKKLETDFNEIYIGHTPTIRYPKGNGDQRFPMNYGQVWNMDTGAAYTGKLTIMDIETKEFWQSDKVKDLYPNEAGR